MSEVLNSAIKKVDLRKHIDAIELEVAKLRGPGGRPVDAEATKAFTESLQVVLRNESLMLAKELGMGGDYPLKFVFTNAIVCLAWSAYSIRKSALDQSLPFEQTLEMVDLASGMGEVLDTVAAEAVAYAELSKK